MNPTLKRVLVLFPIGLLLISIAACDPPTANVTLHNYTLQGSFSAPGFPNVSVQLTPIIPPKSLSKLPTDWVRVDVTVGDFTFSSEDHDFQCFVGVAPFLFTSEVDFPGLIIAAFNNCATLRTNHGGGPMAALLPADDQCQSNCYAMFTFPKNDPSLCKTSSDGSTACFPNTQPSAPPTPTPQPTVCGQDNSTDPTAIISNAQTTGVDANGNLTTPTTTFQVNQQIIVTYDLQPPAGGGYVQAQWDLNGVVYQTENPGSIDACWTSAHSDPVTYNQPGQGLVVLYWCTQSDCSDAQMATSTSFTVTG